VTGSATVDDGAAAGWICGKGFEGFCGAAGDGEGYILVVGVVHGHYICFPGCLSLFSATFQETILPFVPVAFAIGAFNLFLLSTLLRVSSNHRRVFGGFISFFVDLLFIGFLVDGRDYLITGVSGS